MFKTFINAFKVKDVRRKIFYVLMMLVVIRLGSQMPVPGVNTSFFANYFANNTNEAFSFLNAFTGGGFDRFSIFALSITPYITSSIIIQLLTIAIPQLEEMQRDGEEGRKKMTAITRYVTVGLALFESVAMAVGFGRQGLLTTFNAVNVIVVVAALTAGSAFLMWVGEQINDKGVGNGISIILFASIVSRFPPSLYQMITNTANGTVAWWINVLLLLGALAMIVLIVLINDSERRIPVQYAKRVVGRKMYGGQSTHLPMKVNMSGVLPIIFAQSIATLPATIAAFTGHSDSAWASTTSIPYAIIYFLLIIFFAYFYSTIQFNPVEVANNLKKNGGYIPGFRPGKPTSEFIKKVLNKITLFGAIYLGIIAIVPILISHFSTSASLSGISLGGTSIIIVVGVALETVRALEAQMLMRNYKGFLS